MMEKVAIFSIDVSWKARTSNRNVEKRENEEIVNYCRHRCLSTVTIVENLHELYKWSDTY